MEFVKVGKATDVPPGTTKSYEIGDRAVMVGNVNGKYYAVDDVCTHDEGTLGDGDLDDHEVECPRHGARFDIRTGEVKSLPAVVGIDTFSVRVEGEDIEIEV